MKIKKVFALALATSLVLPGVSAFADDNDDLDDRYETYELDDDLDDDDDYDDLDDDDDYDDLDDDDDDYDDLDDDDDDYDDLDDDNDRRKTVKIAPELKVRLRAVIKRTKDSLDYAERIIRANTTNPKVKRLERLVNKQKEIIRKLEILVG